MLPWLRGKVWMRGGRSAALCAFVGVFVSIAGVGLQPSWADAPAHGAAEKQQQNKTSRAARIEAQAPAKGTEKLRKRLAGRWQLVGQNDVLEFRQDGTFSGQSEHAQISGRYEITPSGELLIDLGLPLYTGKPKTPATPSSGEGASATPARVTAKIRRQVRFEKDTLVLEDKESGDVFRYRRVP